MKEGSVALHENGDRFRLNLGAEPFKFDIYPYFWKKNVFPPPDVGNQRPVEAPVDHEAEFDELEALALCCLQAIMDDEQRAVAGVTDDHPVEEVAADAVVTLLEEPSHTWPPWLQEHFHMHADGHVEALRRRHEPVGHRADLLRPRENA